MTSHIDDPQLTAYALGELEGEEKAAVEARLADDAEAREYVEQTRQFAGMLTEELAKETAPALRTASRRTIDHRAQHHTQRTRFFIFSLNRAVAWAACAALIVLVVAVLMPDLTPSRRASQKRRDQVGQIGTVQPTHQDGAKGYFFNGHECTPAVAYNPPKMEGIGVALERPTPTTERYKNKHTPPQASTTPRTPQIAEMPSADDVARAEEVYITSNANGKSIELHLANGKTVTYREVKPTPGEGAKQVRLKIASPPELLRNLRPSSTNKDVVEINIEEAKKVGLLDAGYVAQGEKDSIQLRLSPPPTDREQYDAITDNPFVRVKDDPRSTFSIDVDTASYAIVRRFLQGYRKPPRGAVRIEEMINYFDYEYAQPEDEHPFAVHTDIGPAPWAPKHRLVKIGLKGREVKVDKRPPSNLVFLLDVSGSMSSQNKLPLVKQSVLMLLDQLGENDRVALTVYAGAAGLVLDSTPCDKKGDIRDAISRLNAGGSTAGGAGIQLAYKVARANFIKGGVNRVILCTDGDFNVGISDRSGLMDLIKKEAKSGVFLSVFGFGTGNLQDGMMEELSNKGNGNYGYIDSIDEAKKALVDDMSGTLVTIAKDVKIQIEFNPARVGAFRLIGYENRVMAHQDFNDDKKDAGDIGAGHTVTALYEVAPVGEELNILGIDPLKYQRPAGATELTEAAKTDELMTVKLRYKQPDGDTSKLLSVTVKDDGRGFSRTDNDFQFAAAVAMFGMILRESPYKGDANLDAVLEIADSTRGADPHGYRKQFVDLVKKAKGIAEQN